MLLYNVTTMVNWAVHDAWLQWMQEKHVPAVMQTGCFTDYRFARLLEVDETEGATYSIQYLADSRAQYNRYIEIHAGAFRKEILELWGENCIAFRSLMELVN
jgi:hypothetical protein